MLDAWSANHATIRTGMGTRNEQLAEYFLKAAGVAAVWIDPDGHIGAHDVARIHLEDGRISYCCPRGAHFVLAYRLHWWKQEQGDLAQAAIAARLEELAGEGGVGITAHAVAMRRAFEAVAKVNATFDQMKSTGRMREINRAFKDARQHDPSLRYHDFLHSHKAGLLEQLAREGR